MKTIIESIRDFFDKCEVLNPDARLSVNYLGLEVPEYAIYTDPANPIVKRYVDGGALKQKVFTLVSRNYLDSDYILQLENIGFFERLISWIEDKNKNRDLPILSDNRHSIKIEIISDGFLISADNQKSQYQMQMRLIYTED